MWQFAKNGIQSQTIFSDCFPSLWRWAASTLLLGESEHRAFTERIAIRADSGYSWSYGPVNINLCFPPMVVSCNRWHAAKLAEQFASSRDKLVRLVPNNVRCVRPAKCLLIYKLERRKWKISTASAASGGVCSINFVLADLLISFIFKLLFRSWTMRSSEKLPVSHRVRCRSFSVAAVLFCRLVGPCSALPSRSASASD